jgi:hypothetical protein
MNKELMKQAGFGKEVERVERGECPFCGSTKVKREDFRDEKSWREFHISGLCQLCMDEIFGKD